jgi:hypothetical protein
MPATTSYGTPQQAVEALRPGWKIVGSKPYTIDVDNPKYVVGDPTSPKTIKQNAGDVYSVLGPNGEPDEITLSPATAGGPGKGDVGYTVISGPTKNLPAGTNKPSDPTKWAPVYRVPGDVSSGQVGTWDPVNNDFHAVAAAPDAKATGKYDPVVITDPSGTQRQVGMVDTGDKSFHPLAAAPDAKASGSYDNQYVTNADGTKRLVGMVDTGDKHFIPVSADPTTQKRTIQTPDAIYSVDDNDTVKKLVDINKNVPLQAVVIDGTVFSFDPNEKDPTKRLQQVSQQNLPQTIKQGDTTYVLKKNEDGTFEYQLPPGVKQPGQLNTNTTAKTLDWYDAEGNLIKSQPNQNYVDPKLSQQPQLQAPNTTAPMIMVADPDHPGQTKWIKNEGRVTASQALQQLASQLSGHVVDGNISVDEAKNIIDGANAAMTTATQGAQASLSAINQSATAGANLLTERSRAGQAFVQQTTGLLGQTKHGLIGDVPADFGANVTQGAEAFATRLGGGPEVFQAAANLVRRADPNGTMGQDAAHAYATLSQMFQGYRASHGGQPAPEEVQALQGGPGGQQAGNQAFQSAPFNPQASTAGMNAAGFPDTPEGRTAAMAATPSLLQTPTPPPQAPFQAAAQNAGVQAPFSGSVPGQNYGPATAYTGGIAPAAALPGPSFVAPPPMPGLPPSSQHITITVPTGAGG